jgi:hypothetical protein
MRLRLSEGLKIALNGLYPIVPIYLVVLIDEPAIIVPVTPKAIALWEYVQVQVIVQHPPVDLLDYRLLPVYHLLP